MEYKKLLGVGLLVTTIATTSVAYMSQNDQIQNKINQLYNIADRFKTDLKTSQGQNSKAQQQLTEKQAILDGIAGELGAKDTTLAELEEGLSVKLANRQKEAYNEVALEIGMPQKTLPDFYTAQDIKDWVDDQSQTERNSIATRLGLPATNKENGSTINYTANDIVTAMQSKINQDKQAKINDLAKAVGLPKKDGGYTEETFIAEVEQYIKEVKALEEAIGKGDGSLVNKVKKMIADLEQANQEEQAQLTTAKNKIKALGYCPEHKDLVQLNSDGTCQRCKGGGTTNPPATPVKPEGGTGGQGGTGKDTQLTTLQNNLNNAKESFIGASRGIISDEVIELVCNGDLVIVSNSEITATTEDGELFFNMACDEILSSSTSTKDIIDAGVKLANARQALADYQAQQQ